MIVTLCTVITALCFTVTLMLWVYSTMNSLWIENNASKSVYLSVAICCTIYLLSIFCSFLDFLLILVYGWSTDYNNAALSAFYTFSFLYLLALCLSIYVWIQRLQFIAENSMYGYSAKFIRFLKILFIVSIILGMITLILFIMYHGNENEFNIKLKKLILAFTILFTLLFVGELVILLIAFIYKSVTMRKIAAKPLLDNNSENDSESMLIIEQLLYLQLKLTILVSTQIISTFITLVLVIIADNYYGNIPLAIDAVIGFMCIYCTSSNHDAIFQKACCLCIYCCHSCIIKKQQIGNKYGQSMDTNTVSQHNKSLNADDDTTQFIPKTDTVTTDLISKRNE